MLIIRLQRVGKKKMAAYRLIISEKTRDTKGKYLELLGTFNPHAKENVFKPEVERIKYWLGKGSMMSDTIHNLLVANNIIEGKKKKSVFLSKIRQKKLAEKKKTVTAPAPVETPKETATEVPTEVTVESLTETPADKPAETPVEAPVLKEIPTETSTEVSAEKPAVPTEKEQ